MKNILIIFFLFLCYNVVAQVRYPIGPPTQFSTGYFKQGYHQSDSGTIIANRDTNWLAKYSATIVFKPSNKQFYWFDSTTLRWNLFGTSIDTTSLSNRINLKLNISDTANKWWGIGKRWVDTVYRKNDSTIGFTINNGVEQTFQILGRSSGGGGGSGTVTSVALSMPSAFSVSGSPITTSGTFNVSGSGTAAQYIRGNGTLATTDTGMIPNFYLKVRSLLSGTSPITYNSNTGAIGIPNANTTGQKGAATFNNSDFIDNGAGLISLRNPSAFPGVDTIWRTPGIDSIYFKINSIQYAILDSAGATVTANNGLTKAGDNIQLGGTVIQPTSITSSVGANRIVYSGVSASGDGAQLEVSTTGSVGIAVKGGSTDGRGLFGTATTGVGVYGSATGSGGIGLFSTTTDGSAIYSTTNAAGLVFEGVSIPSSTNTVIPVTALTRSSQSAGGNGIGGSVDMYLHTTLADRQSNRIIYKLTNATDASYTSSMEFWNANSATVARKASLAGSGQWIWDSYGASFETADTSMPSLVVDGSGNVYKRRGDNGGGTILNNIGSGFRLVATSGGNIKTVFGSNTIIVDSSSNSNAITFKADTSVLATQYDLTQLPIPSWQQTLNVSNTHTSALIYDTAMTPDPSTKLWHQYNPLFKSDTATVPYFVWQYSGSNNGTRNEVMFSGWNMGPGGGAQIAGKPAIGESWESNYQINPLYPASSDRLVEKHEIYVSPAGNQYRLSSYTINSDAGTINYYHTVDNFNLRTNAPTGTNTPYFSVQGITGAHSVEQVYIQPSNQSNNFTTIAEFQQDANTASYTIEQNTGKPINLFNLTDFNSASFPSASFKGRGEDAAELDLIGATTGLLGRILFDSANSKILSFTNVPMQFQPNSVQVLDLRSTRANIYMPTAIGTGLGTPIAELDVRSTTQDQTMYIENTKAGGYAAIFTTTNNSGANVGLDITATGAGGNNKGINFSNTATASDWNIYSLGASKTYLNGKVGIGIASPVWGLDVQKSMGANKDSVDLQSTTSTRQMLVIDTSNGKFQRMIIPSAATTIYSGDGTLAGARLVSTGGNTLTVSGANNSDTVMIVNNTGTSGLGLQVNGSALGINVNSSGGTGIQSFGSTKGAIITGDTDEGLLVKSNAVRGARIQTVPSSTNTVVENLQLERGSSGGAGANGIGQYISFLNKTSDNSSSECNTIVSKFTDATTATRTSQLYITGVNSGSTSTLATFDGNGNVTFGTTNSIVGTATNNNAVAGNIGEEVNSTVSTYTNYTTTATYQNITSITLSAGDWDLTAQGTFSTNGATITAGNDAIFVISTTTASASGATEGKNISYVPQAALLGTSHESITIAPYRVSLSGSTTYYLNSQATFTVGNPQYTGTIRARRIR